MIANVLAMIFTAGHHQGGGLSSLWDVAAVYMESVLVFTFIYVFVDVSTPGGAFVWPSRDGEVPPCKTGDGLAGAIGYSDSYSADLAGCELYELRNFLW